MKTMWQDVKYAARMLVKSPGFTLVAIITLALGIGANAAIFSVVNATFLRPLPVKGADRLMVLAISHEGNEDPHPISYLDFEDYRKSADVFEEMTGYVFGFVGMSVEGRAERLTVCFVTPNYFEMLGVNAAAGRAILPGEGETKAADPVIVLGHSYWKKRFGGDLGIVGKTAQVNGRAFTIVGVTPEWFRGTYFLAEFDGYLPLGMASVDKDYEQMFTRRDEHSVHVLGRLKPDVTRTQAQAAVAVIARQLEQQYPESNKTVKAHVIPERLARPDPNSANTNPLVASIFMLLTALVLLVACVNVANLLLLRGTLRQKELAVRAALGAGRARLVRQQLTESVLVSLGGGLAGLVLGRWVNGLLGAIRLPGDLPFRFDFPFDWRVFGFVTAIALLTGMIVGLVPALRASRTNLNDALREGGRALAAGAGRQRMRSALVVAQVSGTLVLLVAAGLFLRSLRQARGVDLGFEPQGVMNFSMDVAQQGYDEARGKTFYKELERRVKALPGVEKASFAYSAPMGYYNNSEYIEVEGVELKPNERRPSAGYNMVGPDYFVLMRIPLMRGRGFTEQDDEKGRRVAVINERMAAQLWPGQDAIGKRFRLTGAKGEYLEVVGVTKTGKYQWLFEDPRMYFYQPLKQSYMGRRVLQVRAQMPETLAVAVQQQIRALDADLPVVDVQTMEQSLDGGNGYFLIRMGAVMAGALGALGLALAVVGVYGVVSYAAGQRTHEIGIRMALGAQPASILRMILSQGLVLVGMGVGIGLGVSLALTRFMANLLFGLSARDPLTFAGVAVLLGVVALFACWVPARRATRVDPMVALHYE